MSRSFVFRKVYRANPLELGRRYVRVIVDPRIELIGVVQMLSGYSLATDLEFDYKSQVEAHFMCHQTHDAVRLFRDMSEKDFNFDAVPNALLTLSYPPELRRRTGFSRYVVKRAGGERKLSSLVTALRDFAERSRFMMFYKSHRELFDEITEALHPEIEKATADLCSYCGVEMGECTLILDPLVRDYGFSATIEGGSDNIETFAIVGMDDVEGRLPTFGKLSGLARFAVHEFSHSFVNPLTEKHTLSPENSDLPNSLVTEEMRRQHYLSRQTVVSEYIIRAITVRLARLEYGANEAKQLLQREKERGFRNIGVLAKKLEEYEASRDANPTIADFYPRLMEVFYGLDLFDSDQDEESYGSPGEIGER